MTKVTDLPDFNMFSTNCPPQRPCPPAQPTPIPGLDQTIINSAFSGNGAGMALWNNGTLNIKNSIIAGNNDFNGTFFANDCYGGSVVSLGHNLVGDNTSCAITSSTGDQFGTTASPINAQLSAIADNGGGTFTHALLSTSPAINAGDNIGCPARDQRSYVRDATCDIGAYEYNAVLGQQPGGMLVAQDDAPAVDSSFSMPVQSVNNQFFQPVSYHLAGIFAPVLPNLALPNLPLQQSTSQTINYVYDPLQRLKEANYSTGDTYHYTYDAVGNRLTQNKSIIGLPSADTYVYDNANRVQSINGVTYTFDANGNLLNDGVNAYTYDAANRLKTLTSPSVTANYAYNGLNDRLRETVNGSTTTFTMDLNMGLTQALSDGTNTFVYGNGRIAQVNTQTEYFLGDALGSVRQMTNASGVITYAKAYDPYGTATSTSGDSQTAYGYTGEFTSNDMVYLRARHYAPGMGRFLTRDTWSGDYNQPMSYNRWNYTYSNPINLTDPSGNFPAECLESSNFADCIREWRAENCLDIKSIQNLPEARQRERIKSFGIILEPEEKWTGAWLANLTKVLFQDIGPSSLRRWMNHKSATLFIDKEGSAICGKDKDGHVILNCYSGLTGLTGITFYHTGTSKNSEINMLHEFGHLVDNLSDSHNDFTNQLRSQTFTVNNKQFWAGWNGHAYASIPKSEVYQLVLKTTRIGGDKAWQQLDPIWYDYSGHEQGEDWADIFSNEILHNINTSTEPGGQIAQFFGDMEKYALSR